MTNGASRAETSANRKTRIKARTTRNPPLPTLPRPKSARTSSTIRGKTQKDKMTELATMVEVVGERRKPHRTIKTILVRTTKTATGATISTKTKESREIVHRVPHNEAHGKITIAHRKGALDGTTISTTSKESGEIVHQVPQGEAHEKITITHGKGALDGTTAALRLQIERQETTRSSFVVVGVRVTMVHSETAIHGVTIPTKTTSAPMDGETIIRKFTIRKINVLAMRLQSECQEADQVRTVTGNKMTMGNGATATTAATGPGLTLGDMQKNAVAVVVQPGVKIEMCTGTKRRKSAGRLN